MRILRRISLLAAQLRHLHLWFAIVLAVIFGTIFAFISHRSYTAYRAELEHDLVTARAEVQTRLQDTIEYLSLLSEEYTNDSLAKEALQNRVRDFLAHHREISSIGLIHTDGQPPWQGPADRRDVDDILQRAELREAMAQAVKQTSFVVSQVFQSSHNEKAFAVFVPIKARSPIVFYCTFSLDRMIRNTIPSWINERYDISFVNAEGQTLARESNTQTLDINLAEVSAPISAELQLRLRLQRYQDGYDWQNILLIVLSIGVIFGVAIAIKELNADRSDKKEAAQRMQIARDLAENANRTKSEFVANVSHELRTPLTAIIGYSDLLIRSLPSPLQLEQNLQAIAHNAQNLLLLINDLLDLSKMESGFLEIHKEPIHLPDFISEILISCTPLAQLKGLSISIGTLGFVPYTVDTDSLRLKQILINVISNAIKFSEKGEIKVRIHCQRTADLRSGTLSFTVQDHGIGIAPLQQNRIFEAFTQADAKIAKTFGGTGLGLSVSRKLALLLDGELTLLQSELGQGSTFACYIPILLPADNDEEAWFDLPNMEAPSQASLPQLPIASIPGRRILVVEDSFDNQRLLREYLERAGATVELCGDGESAVALISKDPHFDLILMDVQLPSIDGYETSRQLRLLDCRIPIVAITAHTSQGEEQRCLAAGCQAYLAKPYDPPRLMETLLRLTPQPIKWSVASPEPPAIFSRLAMDQNLQEIFHGFLERLPDRLTAMELAVQNEDWPKLVRLAHTLKGTAVNFGYPALSEAAGALETRLSQKCSSTELLQICAEMRHIINQMLRGFDASVRE